MGIDWSSLFDQASDKVESSLQDLVKVGRPALEASLEQWGIDTLQAAQKESQGQLNVAIKEITATDPAPGSFGAALSATVKNSVFQTYGLEITLGVAALIVLGIVLGRK